MSKYYTGVGSRNTPKEVLAIMERIATWLAATGWTLRSGGAKGADTAFEKGCDIVLGYATTQKEIYLPKHSCERAEEIASTFHPAWDRCTPFVRALHGRDVMQVLGQELDTPSKFVLCWTPDGCTTHGERKYETGGTGTAISVATNKQVPVFNLARKDHMARIVKAMTAWEKTQ